MSTSLPADETRSTSSFRLASQDVPGLIGILRDHPVNFEVESATSSTISDQPGPGRTLGQWTTLTGAMLERWLGSVGERGGRGPNAIMSMSLPADETTSTSSFRIASQDVSALTEAFHDHPGYLEVESAKSSTVSDQPGPGRTLGRWMTLTGAMLGRWLGSVGERGGRGPNAIMHRILVRVEELERRWGEEWDRRHGKQLPKSTPGRKLRSPPLRAPLASVFRSPPTLASVFEDVSRLHPYGVDNATILDDRRIQKYYRRLVLFLRDSSMHNRFLATYYLTTLICIMPKSIPLLLDMGAKTFLHENYIHLELLPGRNGERDLLLAPSRQALVFLSESEVLSAMKEWDCYPHYRRPVEYYLKLLRYSLISESKLLAAGYITNVLSGHFPWLIYQWRIEPSCVQSWAERTQSPDPLMRSTFSNLVIKIIEYSLNTYIRHPFNSLQVIVLPLCKTLCRGTTTIQTLWVKALSDNLHPMRDWLDYADLGYHLTPEIRSDLAAVIQDVSHDDAMPEVLNVASHLLQALRPFESLYGEFLREWLWPGMTEFSIIKAIAPKRRKQLCRQLMQLLLQSQCSVQDVVRVANRDIACNDEISAILGELLSGLSVDDVGVHELVAEAFGIISKQRPRRKQPSEIYKGVCLSERPYPGSRGQVKAFNWQWPHFGGHHFLSADYRYCSWTKIKHLSSLSPRYKPILLEGGLQDEYICCIETEGDWSPGRKIFSTTVDKILIPEAILSCSRGPVYVLTGRNRDDSSCPYCWKSKDEPDWEQEIETDSESETETDNFC
ncbi:hypothetical protein JAAARDRAFT_42299 [Jaapia argillacea MUCL 33604]|uniref:Uncharacterized protein n=1 Tax=Jaapia argillacea MUCL 33604 TaxID=933084 RepID=A0A067PGQ8_9AGAM|nr:hypothetical protein JAAARDRAFT_42299 [Jaapia argillacea MUCL 33604]